MPGRLPSRRCLVRLAASGLALAALGPRRAHAGIGLLVVTGKGSAVTSISKGELKRLFLGDPTSIAGQTLTAFNLPASSGEREMFERLVLGMTSDQVAKHWIDRRIRGQSGAPKTAPSAEVLIKIAANFPGAIAYLRPIPLGPAVKALAIDGKPPGDPRYLLNG